MYKITYLPVAIKDLTDIVDYLVDEAEAPRAAVNFLDKLDHVVLRLAEFPFSCKVYSPINEMEFEYRQLVIQNYLVFYIVKESTIEIQRIINSRMDIKNIIK